MSAELSRCLLEDSHPEENETFRDLVRPLREADLEAALAGDRVAVILYIQAWQESRQRLLSSVMRSCPHLNTPPLLVEALDDQALQAPFSAWTVRFGPKEGPGLDLLARLRGLLDSAARPLPLPVSRTELAGYWQGLEPFQAKRFYRAAHAALDGRTTQAAQIMTALALNKTELGRLFGVSRQAVDQWVNGEVPSDRQAKAAVVLATIDALEARLKPGRLPGVARKPAAAYGGRTMLQMIAEDDHEALLQLTRRSFDFAATA